MTSPPAEFDITGFFRAALQSPRQDVPRLREIRSSTLCSLVNRGTGKVEVNRAVGRTILNQCDFSVCLELHWPVYKENNLDIASAHVASCTCTHQAAQQHDCSFPVECAKQNEEVNRGLVFALLSLFPRTS